MITYKKDPLLITKKKNIYACLVNPKTDLKDKNFGLRTPLVKINNLLKIKRLFEIKFCSFEKGFLMAIKYLEYYLNLKYNNIYKVKYRYLQNFNKNKINLVFLRIISLVLTNNINDSNKLFFECININGFIYLEKQRLRLKYKTNVLFYLAGVIAGDGHLSKHEQEIIIVDGSTKKEDIIYSKKYICFLKSLIQKEFSKFSTIKDLKTWWSIRVESKWICRYFNYFFCIPFGNKSKIITSLPNMSLSYGNYFWRGLMDTDGSIRKSAKQITFKSSSKNMIYNFAKFCMKNNLKYTQKYDPYKKSWQIQILSISILKYAQLIGFSHPRKQKLLISYLKEGSKIKSFSCNNKKLSMNKQKWLVYLRPYKENVYIKLDEFNRKAKKEDIKYSLSQIKKYFNVKIIKVNRNRYNNHYYICSREFAKFVRENTKSKYLWPKISDTKIKRLIKKWELIHK